MGKGNQYRPKRTGRGTPDAWRDRARMEGEPILQEVFVQPEKKPESNVIDLDLRRPIEATSVHAGLTIPKYGDRSSVYRTGPTPETAARKPLVEESDEKKLARLEKRIQSDEFSEAEREFFEVMVKKYPSELKAAKKKIEDGGGSVDKKWTALVRMSYINDRKRAGLDKNRWEPKIPLAPEKAELFEEYLKLKLPDGIPEEKVEIAGDNTEETRETNFTPEQMAQIRVLLEIAISRFREYYNESIQWGSEAGGEIAKKRYILDQMKKAMENVIRSDQSLKNIFPEEKISKAVEKTLEFAEKFDITK